MYIVINGGGKVGEYLPTVLLQSDLSSIVYTNLPTGEYTFRLCVLDVVEAVVAYRCLGYHGG